MNNKIKRGIAAALTAITLCAPLGMTTSFPNINVNKITASAAEGTTTQMSGLYTGNNYLDPYENAQLFKLHKIRRCQSRLTNYRR